MAADQTYRHHFIDNRYDAKIGIGEKELQHIYSAGFQGNENALIDDVCER